MTAQVLPFRARPASKPPRPLVKYSSNSGICCIHGTKEQLIDWDIVPSENMFPVLPKRILYHVVDPVSGVYSIERIKGGLFECAVITKNPEQFCEPLLMPPARLRSEADIREFLAAITSTLAVHIHEWLLAPFRLNGVMLGGEAHKTKEKITEEFVSAAMNWARTAKIDGGAS